jgi:Holliday junction resolvase
MSKLSRDKGARIEREIVAAHKALGIKSERVPLSGASRYQGNGSDVDVYAFGPDSGLGERRGDEVPTPTISAALLLF